MATIAPFKTSSGETHYRARVRIKGHPIQSKNFESKTKARRWAEQTEAAIRDNRYFKTSEARKRTLHELIDRYTRDVLPEKPKAKKDRTQQLDWWDKAIGHLFLIDVTPAVISEHRDKLRRETTKRKEKRSAASVNRYLAALSHAFTIAVNEWCWLDDSPFRKVKRLQEPRGRVRFLNDEERPRLLEACKQARNRYVYPVIVLALSTGMRYGEILGLKWDDIDLTAGRIILNDTKNKERRSVPLVGHALDVLKEHAKVRRLGSSFVFPSADGTKPNDIRSAFESAVERAKIKNFRFHDLRHCAASYLAMDGKSTRFIAEVLGHKTLQMAQRYSHLSDAHLSEGVASMNKKIFG